MLSLFRRHSQTCSHRQDGRRWKRCKCPIWVDGTNFGAEVRQSMKTRDWGKAEEGLTRLKKSPVFKVDEPKTIEEAVLAFREDAEARHLNPDTLRKHANLLNPLVSFSANRGKRYLAALAFEDMSAFRKSWKDKALSSSKKLERLKSFLNFCVRAGWIKENPAAGVKPPIIQDCPTMPFTKPEMAAILKACDSYPQNTGPKAAENARRLKAFTLALRYTGLRIRDVVQLTDLKVEPGRIFLYQQKTGEPVYVPIPKSVETAIREAPGRTSATYFFWSGEGLAKSCVSDWQRAFRKLFRLAGIRAGKPHRFRDTFAVELLLNGVSMEDVSILLGHRSIKTTQRSYSPWVRARQERLESHVRNAWGDLDPEEGTK